MSLVVIGASANIARVAQSLSDELIFIQQPGTMDPRILRDDVDELHVLDFRDEPLLTSFAERVLRPRGPKAVVSVTENGLLPAAVLSELLNTPGTPAEVVRRTRDKLRMRRTLADQAPHLNVPYADPDDAAAIEELFAVHEAVIAKPVSGTASTDVRLLRSTAEARSLAPVGRYVFEAFVPGAEFSVESFSSAGEHEILAIAEKGTGDNFVEVSHLVPPTALNPAQTERIERAVRELLDALGIRDGPAHTELKLHDDTVRVIETHNRPGGDGIADLVSFTTGVDWRRLSLGWPLGLRPVREITQAAAAANVFFTATPGRVTKVADPPLRFADVQLVYWEVDVKPGDQVGELRSSRNRLGMATITGPSAEACRHVIGMLGHDSVVITEDTAP